MCARPGWEIITKHLPRKARHVSLRRFPCAGRGRCRCRGRCLHERSGTRTRDRTRAERVRRTEPVGRRHRARHRLHARGQRDVHDARPGPRHRRQDAPGLRARADERPAPAVPARSRGHPGRGQPRGDPVGLRSRARRRRHAGHPHEPGRRCPAAHHGRGHRAVEHVGRLAGRHAPGRRRGARAVGALRGRFGPAARRTRARRVRGAAPSTWPRRPRRCCPGRSGRATGT